jgi:hypothetical protein
MKLSGAIVGVFGLVGGACNFDEAELFRDGPWFPGIPDTGVAACNDCMRAECSDARGACMAEGDCRARLSCAAECRDPNCINACDSEALLRQRECEATSGGGIGSPSCVEGFDRLKSLSECAESKCATPCNVGQNWGCVSDYAWAPSDGSYLGADNIYVRHKVESWGDQEFLGGIPNVDVSEVRGPLESFLVTTDAWGWAEGKQGLAGGKAPGTFRLFGRDPSFPVRALVHLGRPRVRADEALNLMLLPRWYPFLFRDQSQRPDPDKSNIKVAGHDCLTASFRVSPRGLYFAHGIEIEIEGAEFATSCHWDITTFFQCGVMPGNNGMFLDVTAVGSPVSLSMRRTSDGLIVGRSANVQLEPGWITSVYVLPLAIE